MATDSELAHQLEILEHIENNPDTTQGDIATQLGVAVGTVNWHIKRLVTKGYVKVTQLQRRRLRYIITPRGIAQRTRLALEYLEASMWLYRKTREAARRLIHQAQREGHARVQIDGEGDIADVVRLTCLEQGFEVATEPTGNLPVVRIQGTRITLDSSG